jgi:hypothetical protein
MEGKGESETFRKMLSWRGYVDACHGEVSMAGRTSASSPADRVAAELACPGELQAWLAGATSAQQLGGVGMDLVFGVDPGGLASPRDQAGITG